MRKAQAIHALVPGAAMLTIAGGGHVTAARDPVAFNRAVREFVAGAPPRAHLDAGDEAAAAALFISSPIGLGHVQRDLAIARELRKLQPDLAIDWFTVDPAARYLEREGERAAPDHPAPGQRKPPLRAAWPASTTCRPSSRCARWTRS